ncbi:uncharacterized protein LOC134672711 [Cydia fagiglandana]|uniref:uncharacterized protein LOC134672711 n=1 Tax=Cydia fagiglandana TaxID=1458189 RepID=UPI002FEE4541
MEQLIAAVRNYPCLWNTTAIEYRDQELKDAAWAEVMKETSLSSVKEVKLKWKKLRDSYRDALKRQSEMMSREPSARKNYPWKYMQHMTFLQPHMSARKKPEEPPPPVQNGHEDHEEQEERNGHTGSSEESETEDEEPKRKSQLTVIDRKLDYLCKASSGKRRSGSWRRRSSPAQPAPDPIDIFFNSMCQTTKRFPYPAQIKIKRVLFDAVLAAEEALLAEQQNYASLWARAASSSSSEAESKADPS